jgi:hypothetical protein
MGFGAKFKNRAEAVGLLFIHYPIRGPSTRPQFCEIQGDAGRFCEFGSGG